jgi:hypothetical protein
MDTSPAGSSLYIVSSTGRLAASPGVPAPLPGRVAGVRAFRKFIAA